uniref:Thiol methyltransferase n=1 Tax=Bionectria ochroleuca TaxID=29856 RepID=A0A8H7TQQ6_BIOOC
MTTPTNIDPKDIRAHWAKYQGDKYVEGWASLWDKSDNLPWDRGFPNPALEDTLVQRAGTIGGPIAQDGWRRKALVPGCGRGVDVLLFASFGYDAYGLECSAAAVEACKKEEQENHGRYRVRDEKVGKGKVTFVQGDFFDNAWLKEIGVLRNGFDVIYDYTFFCALNPELRPKWALRHTELLASLPAGNLICLESPRHKDPLAPGPPFASPSEAYMEHLSHPGEKISYNDKGFVDADPLREPSKAGLGRVAYWQPERTHTVGKDNNGVIHDRVSIWRRRD